ncbi:hypothetical protein HDU85_006764 [Gaertneriomyces sp. JEL0708]|nr:hypothetical protein HDU85_006764 [Gaertneriomyces sp. JEL0708]
MAAESHGIFQFTEDDEWLLSIADAEEVAPKKERHVIDWDYQMKATYEGWYRILDVSHVAERFKEKLGGNEVIHAIEHSYYHKDFEHALKLVREYLTVNAKRKKPYKDWEVLEIGARCCLKLGKVDEALNEFVNPLMEQTREPGQIFLAGQVYSRAGRHTDAMDTFIRYLARRTKDYEAWVEISQILDRLSVVHPEQRTPLLQWALLALQYAEHVVRRSPRADSEIARRHMEVQVQRIADMVSALADKVAKLDGAELDDATNVLNPSQIEFMKVHLLSVEDTSKDEEDEEERGAREL